MKKVLSIALAVVMVLSLAVTAGATWPTTGAVTVHGDVVADVNMGTTRNITIGFSEGFDPFSTLPIADDVVTAGGWTSFTIQNVQTPTFRNGVPAGAPPAATATRPATGRIDVGPRQPGPA